MRYLAGVCLCIVGAALLSSGDARAQSSISAYDTCLSVAEDSPAAALEIARSMELAGEADAGVHCQAVALFHKGENRPAANLFDQLASAANDEKTKAQLLAQSATALLAEGDHLEAIDRAVKASGYDGTSPQPWLLIAEAQSAREEHGEALSALGFAEALVGKDRRVELIVMRAALQRRADQVAAARESLIEALQTEPGYPAALLELGVLFFELSDDANAALVWGDLIDLHPSTGEALQAEKYLTRLKELKAQ